MFDAKSKWMAFPPPPEAGVDVDMVLEDMKLVVSVVAVEQVDEFHYLGYRLDSNLNDIAHTKLINDRYLKAARVVGKLMRDLRCTNPITLKKFFTSLVFSQLYGVMFINAGDVEFEKGVGVFVKTALGLADAFPTVVAMSCMGLETLGQFVTEQRMKFFLKVEAKPDSPAHSALVLDRCVLFRMDHGLNARFGDYLHELGILRTQDYREHYTKIQQAALAHTDAEHVGEALRSEGRAFWTDVFPSGHFSEDLKQVLGKMVGDSTRLIVQLFANSLHWVALKAATRRCDVCKVFFETNHFFKCNRPFLTGRDWTVFLALSRAEEWEDLTNFTFDVLSRWVEAVDIFKIQFRLAVLEYVPFVTGRDPFRWVL